MRVNDVASNICQALCSGADATGSQLGADAPGPSADTTDGDADTPGPSPIPTNEECSLYAAADLFLLARNPGPLLLSADSSFSSEFELYRRSFASFGSEFANFYRKSAGRLHGGGYTVNGCDIAPTSCDGSTSSAKVG